MKTLEKILTNGEQVAKDIEDIVGEPIEVIDGCLQDNYFFTDTNEVTINRFKPRKYIMLLEYCENCWSSNHKLIMTDDEKLFFDTLKEYQKNYDDYIVANS